MSKIRFYVVAVPNKDEVEDGDPYEVRGYVDVDETDTGFLEVLLGPGWEDGGYERVE